ncbi:MAG TPA: hypothetical protein VHG32_12175 [Thermoanaerobaculia bacterium]|jgi:hypothetical protein|nr:hypothetical protein [Thermoanaerobaculia bacterium]
MQANAEHNNEAELEREVEVSSRRVDFCTRAVVLALIFEAVVLWEYSGNKTLRETALFIACDLLLAVAIYGEITFGKAHSTAQSKLKRLSDQRVAASTERAAEANRKAKESGERAAEANQKAEEARLETEKVRLEFERYKADRILVPEQIERIAAKLRPFSGTEYVGAVALVAPEIMHLLENVEDALWRAGWNQISCPDGHKLFRQRSQKFICNGVDAENVRILLRAGSQPLPDSAAAIRQTEKLVALESAGIALAAALMAEGIEATFEATRVALVGAPARTTLNVMIGPKK